MGIGSMQLKSKPIKDLYLNRAEVERLLDLMNNFGNDWVHIINETDNEGGDEGVVVEFFTDLNSVAGKFSTTLREDPLF